MTTNDVLTFAGDIGVWICRTSDAEEIFVDEFDVAFFDIEFSSGKLSVGLAAPDGSTSLITFTDIKDFQIFAPESEAGLNDNREIRSSFAADQNWLLSTWGIDFRVFSEAVPKTKSMSTGFTPRSVSGEISDVNDVAHPENPFFLDRIVVWPLGSTLAVDIGLRSQFDDISWVVPFANVVGIVFHHRGPFSVDSTWTNEIDVDMNRVMIRISSGISMLVVGGSSGPVRVPI